MKIGILGSGSIATLMAKTIAGMEDAECYAVASRDLKKAQKFAKEYGFQKAYGSYEELVKDTEVELIYIATPHSHHFAHAKLCISHKKPVLCEKAFTANAKQAKELLEYAKEQKVFITEAIWTRYMPMRDKIKEVLDSGVIGEPHMLTANLGYRIDEVPRMQDPALAGGALLDVGVYTLNFASMIFGDEVADITSTCTYTDTGVDEQNSITLTYKDGKMAVLNSSMKVISDRKGIIQGSKGFMIIENINNFASITVYNPEYKEVAFYPCPTQITGYEYEVEASIQAIKNGEIECLQMPHEETLHMMQVMDSLRENWGIRYPFE